MIKYLIIFISRPVLEVKNGTYIYIAEQLRLTTQYTYCSKCSYKTSKSGVNDKTWLAWHTYSNSKSALYHPGISSWPGTVLDNIMLLFYPGLETMPQLQWHCVSASFFCSTLIFNTNTSSAVSKLCLIYKTKWL